MVRSEVDFFVFPSDSKFVAKVVDIVYAESSLTKAVVESPLNHWIAVPTSFALTTQEITPLSPDFMEDLGADTVTSENNTLSFW